MKKWKPSLIVMLMGGWIAAGPAHGSVLVNDSFEADTLDASPRSAPLGTDPAGWTAYNETDSGGLQDTSVEAGAGSSFGGGSQSMLLYDDITANPRVDTLRSWTPVTALNSVGLRMQMDLRLNSDSFNGNSLHFVVYENFGGTPSDGSLVGFALTDDGYAGNGVAAFQQIYSPFSIQQTLDIDTWYRFILTLPAPGGGSSFTLRVIEDGFASDNTYTLSFSGGSNNYANYGSINIASFNGGPATYDVNLDNFGVETLVARTVHDGVAIDRRRVGVLAATTDVAALPWRCDRFSGRSSGAATRMMTK